MKYADNIGDFLLAFDPSPLKDENMAKFYIDNTMPIRMEDDFKSPLKDLYKACCSALGSNAHILMGHRGCGKSTELNVFKKRLEADGRKVSVVQCNDEGDLQNLVYWDLLILIGKHLLDIARELQTDLPQGLLQNMADFWKDIEIVITSSEDASTTAGAKVGINIFSIFTAMAGGELKYGQSKRTEIRERVEKNTFQWVNYLTEVAAEIAKKSGKSPVIILEDLDKLSPERAWDIFQKPLAQLPFPVVFTFPIALSYDTRFGSIRAAFNNHIYNLPMIKVRTIKEERHEPGFDILRSIVAKRANLALFEDGVLDSLIEKTGGSLRDLFYYITNASNRAGYRQSATVSMEDAERVLVSFRSDLTRLITTKDYDFLIEVHREKQDISDTQLLLRMIQGQIVLEYNGERWHDLHPLVEDFLRERGKL
ncbi:MAG: ATP-binding protein [Deferribacteraceae bacterium]|nr:ATP-binding protein [Deferribacteraceae bacterium]